MNRGMGAEIPFLLDDGRVSGGRWTGGVHGARCRAGRRSASRPRRTFGARGWPNRHVKGGRRARRQEVAPSARWRGCSALPVTPPPSRGASTSGPPPRSGRAPPRPSHSARRSPAPSARCARRRQPQAPLAPLPRRSSSSSSSSSSWTTTWCILHTIRAGAAPRALAMGGAAQGPRAAEEVGSAAAEPSPPDARDTRPATSRAA